MIRKTDLNARPHPVLQLQADVWLYYDLQEDIAHIDIKKGLGRNATIARNERSFVKFCYVNYGPGKYTIMSNKKGFANFWNGFIEVSRFVREKGSITPYLKSLGVRQWHALEVEQPIRKQEMFN